MNSTCTNSFRQWAQQIYGPPLENSLNAHNVVDKLVHDKHLGDCTISDITSPSKEPLPQSATSSDDTPPTRDDDYSDSDSCDVESLFGISTEKTTPKSFTTNGPSRLNNIATNNEGVHDTRPVWQKKVPETPPGPLILMSQWMYSTLTRIEQLEFLVRLKIKTFREHICAPYMFRNPQLWRIDWEEPQRRRKFFEKNGEEAYLARYINSNYVGRVEFHYIDPKEVY